MQKNIILLFLIFYSCSYLPDSKGDFNVINIIASTEDKLLIEHDIVSLFSDYINTPSEEKLYTLNWVEPKFFNDYLDYKNLLFISLSEPADSTIDLLVSKFAESYNQSLFELNDLYGKKQSLIFLSTDNINSFTTSIGEYSEWILERFNANINENLYDYIYSNGINDNIKELLYKYYKLEFDVQNDFLIVKDSFDLNKFVWIGRGYPYRWITFSEIYLNSDFLLFDDFKKHIRQNMSNVKLTDYYKNLLYESDDIIKIQGLYEEENSNTGGPFVSYAKLNKTDNTALLVTGFVNNPGKNKLRLLKELELQITKTIYRGKNEE